MECGYRILIGETCGQTHQGELLIHKPQPCRFRFSPPVTLTAGGWGGVKV